MPTSSFSQFSYCTIVPLAVSISALALLLHAVSTNSLVHMLDLLLNNPILIRHSKQYVDISVHCIKAKY